MPRVPKPRRKPSLGSNLEWHGNHIRVIVRVPPSKREAIGKAHLKEALPTSSPKEAELLKLPVVYRLKQQIAGVMTGEQKEGWITEAFAWRDAIAHEAHHLEAAGAAPWRAVLPLALTDKAEQIEAKEGEDRARMFVEVASGTATPIGSLVDDWIKEAKFAGRTETAFRHAVKQLIEWTRDAQTAETIEAIDRKVAARFVKERFIDTGTNAATANKSITGLKSYWTWLNKRAHVDHGTNPWEKQALAQKRHGEAGQPAKRPFTPDEVRTLLEATKGDTLMGDFLRVSALTGARRDEVARLKVQDVKRGSEGITLDIQGTKTGAAVRDVPLHPALTEIITRRTEGKPKGAYLFEELPEQKNKARGRGAPITQAFTRLRRRVGIEEKTEGSRQDTTDLHSLRRWFIRTAVEALEDGAQGFTPWTIADVVGHATEDKELGLTMGRYPGKASLKARRACVEAVQIPQPR
jgi:integrase